MRRNISYIPQNRRKVIYIIDHRKMLETTWYIFAQNRACGYLRLEDWVALRGSCTPILKILNETRVWEYCLSKSLFHATRKKKTHFFFPVAAEHCMGFRGDGHRQIHSRLSGDWYHWLVTAYPLRQRSPLRRMVDYWSGKRLRSHYFFFMGADHLLYTIPNFFYWETHLVRNHSVESRSFSVSIGMATFEDIRYLSAAVMHVGFTSRSIGYQQDGSIVCNDSVINGKKETYHVGDIIGCGLDLERDRLFWTKNGVVQFETTRFLTSSPLLPIVQASPGLFVTMNYGEKPFRWSPGDG